MKKELSKKKWVTHFVDAPLRLVLRWVVHLFYATTTSPRHVDVMWALRLTLNFKERKAIYVEASTRVFLSEFQTASAYAIVRLLIALIFKIWAMVAAHAASLLSCTLVKLWKVWVRTWMRRYGFLSAFDGPVFLRNSSRCVYLVCAPCRNVCCPAHDPLVTPY